MLPVDLKKWQCPLWLFFRTFLSILKLFNVPCHYFKDMYLKLCILFLLFLIGDLKRLFIGLSVRENTMLSREQVCESETYVSSIDPGATFPVLDKTLINTILQFQESSTESPDFLYPTGEELLPMKFLPRCRQLSLSQSLLLEPSMWRQERIPSGQLTKGIVCEMLHLFSVFPNKVDMFAYALSLLFQVTQSDKKKLFVKATRVQTRYSVIQRSKSSLVKAFLAETFQVPTSRTTVVDPDNMLETSHPKQIPGDRKLPDPQLTKSVLNTSVDVSLVSLQDTPSVVAIKLEHQREKQALHLENENLRSTMASRLSRSRELLTSAKRSKRHFIQQARLRSAEVQQLRTEVQDLKQQLRKEQKAKEKVEKKCAKTVQEAEGKCAEAVKQRRNLQSKVSYHRTKTTSCPTSTLANRKIEQLKVRKQAAISLTCVF